MFSRIIILTVLLSNLCGAQILETKDSTGRKLKDVVNAHYATIFEIKNGTAFMTYGKGAGAQRYEIREFSLRTSKVSITEADKMNGEKLRIYVSVRGKAHRKFKDRKWSEWAQGPGIANPFANIIVKLKNGKFVVSDLAGSESIQKRDTRPNKGIQRL